MKTLIILLLISINSFAATHEEHSTKDRLKWLKLGYEVARAHAPDYEIVEHLVAEKCEEAETLQPERGAIPIKGYEVTKYWNGNKLETVHWRCTKALTKG